MKRLHHHLSLLCLVAILLPSLGASARPFVAATPPANEINKADLHQALVDLTNLWTVMCVAAHPDDEDGTTLTVLRRRDGAHTVSLFSTYGEGGQNAVGPELYEELGVIRAKETRGAAKIQGSEPYFLGLKDFGFSKSADEAFKVWGHDEALRRMVLKIRQLKPDVVITNHDTVSGHGHHQATGRLIIEAFDAAADPKRFPEQLSQAQPWQIKRLFVRAFGAQQVSAADAQKMFAVDPNEMDAVRRVSFAEEALTALHEHATQGPWPKTIADMMRARRIEGGRLPPIRYKLIREATGTPSLPDNPNTPYAGMSLSPALAEKITPPTIAGKPLTDFLDQPDKILGALVDWRAAQTVAPSGDDADRLRLWNDRVNRAVATAAGVSLTLTSANTVLVPGTTAAFSINLSNDGLSSVHVDNLQLNEERENLHPKTADVLLPGTDTTVPVDYSVPNNVKFTVPKEEHLYDDVSSHVVRARADLEMDGAKFSVSDELRMDVAPAVEIRKISPAPVVWAPGHRDQPLTLTMVIKNNLSSPFKGVVEISSPMLGITALGSRVDLAANETRSIQTQANSVRPARNTNAKAPSEVAVAIKDSEANVVTRRSVPVAFTNARVVEGLNVGYLPSFDQTIENSLAALGVKSHALTIDEIKTADLSVYNTIIIDNRGYEAHPDLIAANPRLLEFVSAGGTLIVFYHKDNEWNPDEKKNRPQLAPYSIVLDDKRVTDETAAITFLQPKHPLLNSPNAITAADFANWIQERGLYYPKTWDAHYVPIFSTNDPGEAPLTGGLLVTQYGKGNYIYTSMVWYRELRAGLPGAYRMFANMISYGSAQHPR